MSHTEQARESAIAHYYTGGQVAVFDAKSCTYDLYADADLDEYLGNVDAISAADF